MKHNIVKCPLRYRVNLKACRATVREGFVLHLQSDSEHVLTDPFTSLLSRLPVAPVLRCTVFVRRPNTSFYWCAGPAHRTFRFLPSMPEVFASRKQCKQIFSLCLIILVFHSRWSFKSFGTRDSDIRCQRRGHRLSCVGISRKQAFSSMFCCSETSPFPICRITTSRGKHSELGIESAS